MASLTTVNDLAQTLNNDVSISEMQASSPKVHELVQQFADEIGVGKSASSLLLLQRNCVFSSLGTPFLVLSKESFIRGHSPPSNEEEYTELLGHITSAVSGMDSNSFMFADFEGEMPGFGSDISVAQFMRTSAMQHDRSEKKKTSLPPPESVGYLFDLRDAGGVLMTKRIMESSAVSKIIWGATGDLTSMRHQKSLGGIRPKNVMDIQLAYSRPGRLLGMAKMLDQRVPYSFKKQLPGKDIHQDWSPRAYNRRCVPLPISRGFALYAMDDLHRIDAIVRSQDMALRRYLATKEETKRFIVSIETASGALKSLFYNFKFFERKHGMQKKIKAVEFTRQIINILGIFGSSLSANEARKIDQIKKSIQPYLVCEVPNDLSFY